MTSSSHHLVQIVQKGKIVGFTLDIHQPKKSWYRFFFFLGGGVPGKGGVPLFSGRLETQGETMPCILYM